MKAIEQTHAQYLKQLQQLETAKDNLRNKLDHIDSQIETLRNGIDLLRKQQSEREQVLKNEEEREHTVKRLHKEKASLKAIESVEHKLKSDYSQAISQLETQRHGFKE